MAPTFWPLFLNHSLILVTILSVPSRYYGSWPYSVTSPSSGPKDSFLKHGSLYLSIYLAQANRYLALGTTLSRCRCRMFDIPGTALFNTSSSPIIAIAQPAVPHDQAVPTGTVLYGGVTVCDETTEHLAALALLRPTAVTGNGGGGGGGDMGSSGGQNMPYP
ncbi:hypothetical protein V8F33_014159 [Rhypophila sp. PSN 637]